MEKDLETQESGSVSTQKFALVGGFLGAGKTTLIAHFAEWLRAQNQSVALVTNDQGDGLLDTASAIQTVGSASQVREITGGCFCCKLDDLVAAVRDLDASERPNVIVAEPVGSCTDLMATVIRPLEKVYGLSMELAPLSVVLDARRALLALGGRTKQRSFHKDVSYIYRKQLEEAEWLVVNKTDLLDSNEIADLRTRLQAEFPEKPQFFLSGKTGEGFSRWFKALAGEATKADTSLIIDYQRYAVGEAMLGWVNQTVKCKFRNQNENYGNWLSALWEKITSGLQEQENVVAHFKMSLSVGSKRYRVHQVLTDDPIEVIIEESKHLTEPELLINLRAQGDAQRLRAIVLEALSSQAECEISISDEAAFQPGEPKPTYRLAN